MASCEKCYQSKIPYILKLRNTRSIKFVSRTSLFMEELLSYCLTGLIQLVCCFDVYLFAPFHLMA